MMKRTAGLLLGVLLAGSANAAMVWVNNLTIDSYRAYWDGSNAIIEVRVKEDITGTGCAVTDNNNLFSYWNPSSNEFHQIMLAQAVAADSLGRKVNIMYDNTACGSVAGRLMFGIHVLPAQ